MIRTIRHRGLKRLHDQGDASRLRADQRERIGVALAILDSARSPNDLAVPGFRLHQLKGRLRGFWSIRITGNWRIVFRFDGDDVFDVDYVDYH
ncbi:MAG: type II toxin-antitoxin system mRNA interferase toxin, RelE/StbE family [Chloroflexota bacterium]|nr:type II toxin-antitoxin system mRNA interferase toxin, RelE/StbE family [Chloroflexota bacterium]